MVTGCIFVYNLKDCADKAISNADTQSKYLVAFYAGKSVALYDTLPNIWIPATVLHSCDRTASKCVPVMLPVIYLKNYWIQLSSF